MNPETARTLTDLARTGPYSAEVLKRDAGLVDTVLRKQSQADGLAYIGHREAAALTGTSPETFRNSLTKPGPWVSVATPGQAGQWAGHAVATAFQAIRPAQSQTKTAPLGLIDPRHSLWRSHTGLGPLAWRLLVASAGQTMTTAQARSWLAADTGNAKTVSNTLGRLQASGLLEKASRGIWAWNAFALDAWATDEDATRSCAYDRDQQEQQDFDTWHRDRHAGPLQQAKEIAGAEKSEPVTTGEPLDDEARQAIRLRVLALGKL